MAQQKDKCWIAEFNGHYLGGYALVFAETEADALMQVHALIEEHHLSESQKPGSVEVREVPMNGAHLIWNGDY